MPVRGISPLNGEKRYAMTVRQDEVNMSNGQLTKALTEAGK